MENLNGDNSPGNGVDVTVDDIGPEASTTPLTNSSDAVDLNKASNGDSGIVTMMPYIPPVQFLGNSTRGKSKNLSNQKIRNMRSTSSKHYNIMPGVRIPVSFEKYITVKLDDAEADIFNVHRDIVKCCGREPKISPLTNGQLLVEANSEEESKKLQKISNLGGVLAECTPHASLNFTKGLIYAPQLMTYSEEKLQLELEAQGVSKVERMKKKVGGALTPLPTLILTFAQLRLPEVVSAAWLKYKVRQYIPKPRRCFYCQEFGHVLATCRAKQQGKPSTCVNCGCEEHGECSNAPSCIHCGGNHPSSYSGCNVFLFEKEVQATRVIDKVTFAVARQKVKETHIKPGLTFAKVLSDSRNFKKTRLRNDTAPSAVDKSKQNLGRKRSISNEATAEPPHKSTCSQNSPSEAIAGTSKNLALSEVTTETNANASSEVIIDKCRKPPVPRGPASALADAVASSEAASAPADALASSGAASAPADALASSGAASAPAGALASSGAASARADEFASSEAASASADALTSLEAVSALAGTVTPSEVTQVLADASASLEEIENISTSESLEIGQTGPMETDLASQSSSDGPHNKKMPLEDKAKLAASSKALKKQKSSCKRLVRNPNNQGSKWK